MDKVPARRPVKGQGPTTIDAMREARGAIDRLKANNKILLEKLQEVHADIQKGTVELRNRRSRIERLEAENRVLRRGDRPGGASSGRPDRAMARAVERVEAMLSRHLDGLMVQEAIEVAGDPLNAVSILRRRLDREAVAEAAADELLRGLGVDPDDDELMSRLAGGGER